MIFMQKNSPRAQRRESQRKEQKLGKKSGFRSTLPLVGALAVLGLGTFAVLHFGAKKEAAEIPAVFQLQANRHASLDAIDFESKALVISNAELGQIKKDCSLRIESAYSQVRKDFPQIPSTMEGIEHFLKAIESLIWKGFKEDTTPFLLASFAGTQKGTLDCDSGSMLIADVLNMFGLRTNIALLPKEKVTIERQEGGNVGRTTVSHVLLKVEFPQAGTVYFEVIPGRETPGMTFFWSLEELEKINGEGKMLEMPASGNGPLVAMTRAYVFYLGNFYDRAIEDCKYALSQEPMYADAYSLMADCYLRMGNTSAALECCKKANSLGLEGIFLTFNYAKALAATGNKKEASLQFLQYLKNCPTDAEAHFFLGNCHYSLGELEKAETELSLAISIAPKFAQAYFVRAEVRAARGKLTLAKEDMKKTGELGYDGK